MSAIVFDTLKYANRLKQADVPDKQAEAEAAMLREVLDARDQALAALQAKVNTLDVAARQQAEQNATKADVKALDAATESKFDLLRKDTQSAFALVRKDMDTGFALVRNEIGAVEQRLDARFDRLKWMLGVLLTGMGAILLKLFLG